MSKKDIEKKLIKKENLSVVIPEYSEKMMASYYEYAIIKLSLLFYTMKEVIDDNIDVDSSIVDSMKYVSEVINKVCVCRNYESIDETINKIADVRNTIIKKMEILTAYTDNLQVFQHIFNRIEYSLSDKYTEVDIDQEVNLIFSYIFNKNDNVVVNAKIKEIIGELPVRMTKNRFYDLLHDALSIYTGADKSAAEDFIESIRSVAVLNKPEGFAKEYTEISDFISELQKIDYKNITLPQLEKYIDEIDIKAEKITTLVTNYMQLEEIVNCLYVVLISSAYDLPKENEGVNLSVKILESINSSFIENNPISEEVDALLCQIEGKQESSYENISRYESVLLQVRIEDKEIIEQLSLKNKFDDLYTILKLLSNSLFIRLNESEETIEVADTSFIMCKRDELVGEFSEMFKSNSKEINRSIMARVLSVIPVFFNSQEEIKKYLSYSIEHCSNKYELTASLDIIHKIIKDESYE